MISFFLKGLLIGFSIAAPVGPIGLLCIQQTLSGGRVYGLLTGLGAAGADAVYGSIAGFGLSAAAGLLVGAREWIGLFGGVFLLWLGARTFLAPPPERAAEASGRGLAGAFFSTFILTLTNPMTILSFTAVFAGLGIAGSAGDHVSSLALVAGVFLGSAAWWLLLSGGVALLGRTVTPRALRLTNRLSGAVIAAFGIVALSGGLG